MKCFITGKELKEDYQTLGWEGNEEIKREITPEMAKKIIETHFDYLEYQKSKGFNIQYLADSYLISTCKDVIQNYQYGDITLILLPYFKNIMKEFVSNMKIIDK